MHDDDDLRFYGNVFNFCGRNSNSAVLNGIDMPIYESRAFHYGIYRRVWRYLPVDYESFFHHTADLSVFFNYVVPPRISGKVITTVHDMTCMRFPETMNARNRRRLAEGLIRSAARSDRILTVTEFSKKEICTLLHVPCEQIEVIPCAPNYTGTTNDWEAVRAKYGIEGSYILYVGTIEPRKNVARLLQAFDKAKKTAKIPHKLVLAGGMGWNNGEFDRALAGSAYRDDIVLTGYVTTEEKDCLYQHADIFVFPSLYEGFGIPPLEAMHFGCPVVCADAASLPEVVGEAAEKVNPYDIDSIAEGMLRVLLDEERKEELRRFGYIQEKKYTWDASAEKLKAVCREVLNER